MTVIRRPARTAHLGPRPSLQRGGPPAPRAPDRRWTGRITPSDGEWMPSVDDLTSAAAKLTIVAEVPGSARFPARSTFRDRHLVITGERRDEAPGRATASFLCMERPQGASRAWSRSTFRVDVRSAEARAQWRACSPSARG